MRYQTAVLLAIVVLLSSCAHVISRESRRDAVTGVPFSELRKEPLPHLGQKFILGGTIAEVKAGAEQSELEVVQHPLDSYGYILTEDLSDGRFLVIANRHLDPMIFKRGRQVTIAGILAGTDSRKLGETNYRYPRFDAVEIRLWREGAYYYSYPPYYWYPYPYPASIYWYWYDPFWPYPYYPHRHWRR